MTDPSGRTSADLPADVDPVVAETVVSLRDRFGLRGLRAAEWLIAREIELAEEAMRALDVTDDG
jgi:hypothetical protein